MDYIYGFKLIERCVHCGQEIEMLVRSDMQGDVQVAIRHENQFELNWHKVTGFKDKPKLSAG